MVPNIVMGIHKLFGVDVDEIMEYYDEAVELNPSCGIDEFLMGFFTEKCLGEVKYPTAPLAGVALDNHKSMLSLFGFVPAIMVNGLVDSTQRDKIPNGHFLWRHGWTDLSAASLFATPDFVHIAFPKLEVFNTDMVDRTEILESHETWKKIMYEKITGEAIIMEG